MIGSPASLVIGIVIALAPELNEPISATAVASFAARRALARRALGRPAAGPLGRVVERHELDRLPAGHPAGLLQRLPRAVVDRLRLPGAAPLSGRLEYTVKSAEARLGAAQTAVAIRTPRMDRFMVFASYPAALESVGMDRSAAERLVKKDLDGTTGLGKPISSRARLSQRTVEAYLKAGVKPRWMERISEIDDSIKAQKRRLERSHRALREECDGDARCSPSAGARSPAAAASTRSTS